MGLDHNDLSADIDMAMNNGVFHLDSLRSMELASKKILNDPVHGHMELDPLCVKIIDTPQFQRLRNIQQLGTVYYVYPGATHHRFEHCIGVSYLAGQYGRHLQKMYPTMGITNSHIRCLEIAGLCHDLGHGPYSHLWERFMSRVLGNKHWKHENISVDMFKHLIRENNLKEALDEVADEEMIIKFITGEAPTDLSDPNLKFKFLYRIVNNALTGIDVDKCDYILRDTLHLHVPHQLDYNRIMMMTYIDPDTHELMYRDKLIQTLYDIFVTRFHLHKKAYQHRVVRGVEEMLIDAFLLCNESHRIELDDGRTFSLSACSSNMYAYKKLHDSIFYDILNGVPCAGRSILERIEKRDIYELVGSFSSTQENNEEHKIWIGEWKLQWPKVRVCHCLFDYGAGGNLQNASFCDRFGKKCSESEITQLLLRHHNFTEHLTYVFLTSGSSEGPKQSLSQWAQEKNIQLDLH